MCEKNLNIYRYLTIECTQYLRFTIIWLLTIYSIPVHYTSCVNVHLNIVLVTVNMSRLDNNK